MTQVTGILLAAGYGQRFGSNKLLHPLGDGTPLILHSVRALKAALEHTVVVVNARHREVIALLKREGVSMVINQSSTGTGKSIACGVQASRRADGWVIALGDMPLLSIPTIQSVAEGIRSRNAICAPAYGNRRGHPVGFGKAYAKELMQLNDDEGARHIIAANRDCLELIETADAGVITDIDYPQDIQRLGEQRRYTLLDKT